MDAETTKYLVTLGRASADPVVRVPGLDHTVLVRQADGKFQEYAVPPAPRKHAALSLAALVTSVSRFGVTDDGTATVWHGPDAVTAVLDADRREATAYRLELSTPFKVLGELEKTQQGYDQRSLVKLLRVTFKDCLAQCPTLVETVRRVRLVQGSDATGVVQHGKSSVGRAITAEVTGTGNLPEYVVLTVPVFRNPDLPFTAPVECAFEPNPDNGTFQVIPLPGQLDRARAAAEYELALRLRDELDAAGCDQVPVLNGSP